MKLKYSLTHSPALTTAAAISDLLAPFGPTDTSSIILSLKAPKKTPTRPANNGTALVQFSRIGDAYAVVCASTAKIRNLEHIKASWVDGKEPEILGWLRMQGKLEIPNTKVQNQEGDLPQHKASTGTGNEFSSFPTTFVSSFQLAGQFSRGSSRISSLKPSPSTAAHTPPAATVPGTDYESLTLMRLRQAERARLEQEIRESEAAEES